MSYSLRLIVIFVGIAASCLVAQAQLVQPRRPISPEKTFPPEIVLDRFIDVVKIAPKFFTVELENTDTRVLRAKLDGSAKIPLHDARSGVMVALKEVSLALITPEGHTLVIQLNAGETKWIDGDAYRLENLNSSPTEFLYIEMLRPKSSTSDAP